MQIIDTDSINCPFVQICVIGGFFKGKHNNNK